MAAERVREVLERREAVLGFLVRVSLYHQRVQIALDDVLAVVGDSLLLLLLGSNYPSHKFSWIRSVGSTPDGKFRIVETMFSYPVALRWVTDVDGRVVDVGRLLLAADPGTKSEPQFCLCCPRTTRWPRFQASQHQSYQSRTTTRPSRIAGR
jgi:hypothetical protein